MQKQTRWFILKSNNPKLKESFGYSCTTCGIYMLFGDGEKKAFCCSRWVTPPEKTFWNGGEFPVVQSAVPWRPTTLPGQRIDFAEGAEESNAQAGF
jgi:hypothetical protein